MSYPEIIFDSTEYGQELYSELSESQSVHEFSYTPEPPVTISRASIEMVDDYNGYICIEFSNEDTIEYECKEIRGVCGCDTEISIKLNGDILEADVDLGDLMSGRGWIDSMCNYYINKVLKK